MEQEIQEFRNLSLNATLIREIETYIEKTRTYKSLAEFVNEAIRLRLEELKEKGA